MAPVSRPCARVAGRARAGYRVLLLLLIAAVGIQAQRGELLQRGAQASLNLDQLPWGQASLDHAVPSSEAGVSGVFLPPFAHQGAIKLKPHTVCSSHLRRCVHALV
jgi:hypothetical protein